MNSNGSRVNQRFCSEESLERERHTSCEEIDLFPRKLGDYVSLLSTGLEKARQTYQLHISQNLHKKDQLCRQVHMRLFRWKTAGKR
jgi:hypothetical protein